MKFLLHFWHTKRKIYLSVDTANPWDTNNFRKQIYATVIIATSAYESTLVALFFLKIPISFLPPAIDKAFSGIIRIEAQIKLWPRKIMMKRAAVGENVSLGKSIGLNTEHKSSDERCLFPPPVLEVSVTFMVENSCFNRVICI